MAWNIPWLVKLLLLLLLFLQGKALFVLCWSEINELNQTSFLFIFLFFYLEPQFVSRLASDSVESTAIIEAAKTVFPPVETIRQAHGNIHNMESLEVVTRSCSTKKVFLKISKKFTRKHLYQNPSGLQLY